MGFVLGKLVVRQVLGSAEAILDVAVRLRMYDIYIYIYMYIYIQGVTGGTDQTSGECSLC